MKKEKIYVQSQKQKEFDSNFKNKESYCSECGIEVHKDELINGLCKSCDYQKHVINQG